MPAFPRCIKCVTTSTVDDIETLDVKCTAPCGRDKFYISVRDYFKSPVLHSREDPLPVAFVAPDKKNMLVNIDPSSKVHAMLLALQAKCMANCPEPTKTQPFLKTTSDGQCQIRLKTQQTQWKDTNGTMVSMDEALIDPKSVLSTWVIEMYRLWRQRDGTWHVVWVLNKARATPAPAEDENQTADAIDDIEW